MIKTCITTGKSYEFQLVNGEYRFQYQSPPNTFPQDLFNYYYEKCVTATRLDFGDSLGKVTNMIYDCDYGRENKKFSFWIILEDKPE